MGIGQINDPLRAEPELLHLGKGEMHNVLTLADVMWVSRAQRSHTRSCGVGLAEPCAGCPQAPHYFPYLKQDPPIQQANSQDVGYMVKHTPGHRGGAAAHRVQKAQDQSHSRGAERHTGE